MELCEEELTIETAIPYQAVEMVVELVYLNPCGRGRDSEYYIIIASRPLAVRSPIRNEN